MLKERQTLWDYEERQWGKFWTMGQGPLWKTKMLVINVGAKLSYQRHFHRHERWNVVEGVGELWLDGENSMIQWGDIAIIEPLEWHTVENRGKIPLKIVENWLGCHLSEDDIERKGST